MKQTALTLYRRFCKAKAEWRGESILSKTDHVRLQEIIRQNRRALKEVDDWLPAGLLGGSVFRYGVNPDVEKLLNLPLDNECSLADLLAYFGRTLNEPLKYLELGVSVGKTFWQILNTCAPCECWAFDIEEINPVLKQRFVEQSRDEWSSPPDSMKKTASSITHFVHPSSGGKIHYICADIFDERAWQLLAGQGFNLILSDALHTPQALDFEWRQMTKLNIFSPKDVTIMWDDLDGRMKEWFHAKRPDIAGHLGVDVGNVGTLFLNGWLGRREFPHRLGLGIRNCAA
ncbi:MAG: hypothetical protein LV480_08510 [Methylacidiphilales bacterium]|nr:hypothetical protein [Candidatus Methylacidiphilales bacterium]